MEKDVQKSYLLPHKTGGRRSETPAFITGREFEVKLSLTSSVKYKNGVGEFNIETLISLFRLMSVLGGLGKRSRRGMGSFEIINPARQTPSDLDEICKLINACVVKKANEMKELYKISPTSDFIQFTDIQKKYDPEDYGMLHRVEIGTNNKTPEKIGWATHDVKNSNNKEEYGATLGDGRPRFASPIIISILPTQKPIVSTLKTVSPNFRKVEMSLQKKLKDQILK
ncbi:MAG: hypothetical protein R3B93_21015 [Bacteroidia bacterium]